MPNWCDNVVTIEGSPKSIKKLHDVIQNKDDTLSLTNCYPVPDVFKDIHSGARKIDGVQVSVWRGEGSNAVAIGDNEFSQMLKLYGVNNSLDWQYRNWGTKWGDIETRIVEQSATSLVVAFDTAWGEPFLLLDKICQDYKVNMTNSYWIEGWQEFDEREESKYPFGEAERKSIYKQNVQMMDNIRNVQFKIEEE